MPCFQSTTCTRDKIWQWVWWMTNWENGEHFLQSCLATVYNYMISTNIYENVYPVAPVQFFVKTYVIYRRIFPYKRLWFSRLDLLRAEHWVNNGRGICGLTHIFQEEPSCSPSAFVRRGESSVRWECVCLRKYTGYWKHACLQLPLVMEYFVPPLPFVALVPNTLYRRWKTEPVVLHLHHRALQLVCPVQVFCHYFYFATQLSTHQGGNRLVPVPGNSRSVWQNEPGPRGGGRNQ